ncbi:hypothetical protein O181_133209 [Austropuccinia psidii MF-1]|uniref:Uncharacterized protein n=1 Tax=Austropuccinia psidii MF-1 TaxID=1389203 RepID=A0A9Q3QCS3_9BASI|nr:hypothetical protein [Austropuccinia psidii MF-1]
MAYGPWTVNHGPWAVGAIGGLNERGWLGGLEAPRRQKDPPGPKSKMKAWGLVRWKFAKEANDSRIWPEAINGHWNGLWHKSHRTPKGANWP